MVSKTLAIGVVAPTCIRSSQTLRARVQSLLQSEGTVMEPKTHNNVCVRCSHAPHCLYVPSSSQPADFFQFPARILKRGEHLCRQGQLSNNLYILRAGLLKSYVIKQTGEEFVMGFYLPPDLFGWEGIEKTHRSITIVAIEQSNICVVPTEKMFVLTQKIPSLGKKLLRMVSRRIQDDNVALLRTTAHQRVATFLLQLISRYQQFGFRDHSCPLLMTHQDIANYLRMTPSTISRIFHEWQQKKMIKIDKHMTYVLDLSALQLMAG